ERQPEQQQTTVLVKDNKIQGNGRISEKYKIILEEELKENIVTSIRKEQIKWYNPAFMIKKAKGKWRKILDAKALNKQIAYFHFKMHDSIEEKQTIKLGDWGTSLDRSSAFHHLIVQIESQPYLVFEFQNNNNTYRAMLFGTKHSPIYFAIAMEPIMRQVRMKIEIKIINYIDDILLLHQNKEYQKNMTHEVIDTLKYFWFTINIEKSETEPKQTVIFLGREWNITNVTVKTKRKKRLLFLHDLYNMRRWIKIGTEIAVKQTAKLIRKLNHLRQQFQEASLFLSIMDQQKAQTARMRGRNTMDAALSHYVIYFINDMIKYRLINVNYDVQLILEIILDKRPKISLKNYFQRSFQRLICFLARKFTSDNRNYKIISKITSQTQI
ncbi:MAG: hypothetical protein EZS28_006302, partial [Streblomastix strix]